MANWENIQTPTPQYGYRRNDGTIASDVAPAGSTLYRFPPNMIVHTLSGRTYHAGADGKVIIDNDADEALVTSKIGLNPRVIPGVVMSTTPAAG